jgi:hypothetical protein
MNHPPLAVLKIPLLMLAAALLFAVAGTLWSHGVSVAAATAKQHKQSELNQARQQLDRSRHQQALIAAHLSDYQTLVGRGFVGAEDRLAWIEAVQLANRDAALYGLDYRLTPRTPSPTPLGQGLPLAQTSMTLSMPLLVETDLGRFLAALKARASGVYRVHGCTLARLGGSAFQAANTPQLRAECELLWFTVDATSKGGT